MDFAVAVLHAEQPHRRQDQRHRRCFAQDRGGEIALGDIHQHALAKLDLLQIVAIGAQRLFGIGAAIGVVEKRLGHAAPVKLAQIFNAGDVLHVHAAAVPYERQFQSSTNLDHWKLQIGGTRYVAVGRKDGAG